MTDHIWRLIDTGPLDGASNMAIDEALLLSFNPATSLPVLRFYGWEPPALSLGRFQNAADTLNLSRCRSAAVPVVRRVTGGGVIYHADELTYSIVCAPRHLPPAASVKESFRHLTAFLLRCYERLGLAPRYAGDHENSRSGERTPFCFAGQETYDILIGGKKIGGNAQRRLKETIFQHGSIPLRNRAAEGAGFMRKPPEAIGEQTLSLGETGSAVDGEKLKPLLRHSFREAMGVTFLEDDLSLQEKESALALRGKYGDDCWNLYGEVPG